MVRAIYLSIYLCIERAFHVYVGFVSAILALAQKHDPFSTLQRSKRRRLSWPLRPQTHQQCSMPR